MPPSIAASDVEALVAWGAREGTAVLKPLHQAQSKGVERLDFSSESAREAARAKLLSVTEQGRTPVLLQRFLPGIALGETRLWFLNGRLLAQARKLPKQGEFRIDMDRGGSLARHELTEPERKAAERIGRHLRSLRVRMAAVDLIDGYVTDCNFTSPGLIAGMEDLLGENLARPVVESLVNPWS
jgi:glutathione synthase